ncbi:MAG: hypothetical protein JJ974_08940 [Phycisphaerales bacterium]|nr:hypothetical protein [Phycisphaerales bacterium]
MTDRRPGPPLFELLNQDQPDPKDGHSSNQPNDASQPTPPKPAPATSSTKSNPDESLTRPKSEDRTPTPQTQSTPPISAGVSRAERSAATMPEDPPPAEPGIHLSTSRLYLSIAIVAIALVLVWATAYKAGVADGKGQMESFIADKPLILPPNDSQTDLNPQLNNQQGNSNNDPVPTDRVSEPPNAPARAAQAVMTAQGYKDQDPRIPGHNYLQLATFSAEQAADAILFMNDHDMPIIGVPVVDSRVRAGNNPSRYTLYSVGLAVPGGGQFRAMQAQRDEHVRAIATLGARWQKERQGGSDFAESKTQWVKFN